MPPPARLVSSKNDANHPPNLLSALHYNAAAELTAATLGNGLNETHTYDSRFRPLTIGAGSVYNVTIPASGGYAPNSNILSANDPVNGNWTYSYDDFNRLGAASATGQAYTWDYDRYGNRWHQNGPNSAQYAFDANNRVASGSGVTYDAAGEVTNDGTSTFTYDAENRMTSATNASRGLTCYIYNASGQRVRKTFSTVGTCAAPTSSTPNDYIYDIGGHIVGIPGSREEIFAGNRHLGTYVFSTTYFVHSDWLGTERARSSATGTPYETATSLPFGDALTSAGGSDPSPLHFTGLQHDYEITEDHTLFRQYSPLIGRWSIPDPADLAAANPTNPQSWNRYAYVGNDPMDWTDPLGLGTCKPNDPNPACHGSNCRNPAAGCLGQPPGLCDSGNPLCIVPSNPNGVNCTSFGIDTNCSGLGSGAIWVIPPAPPCSGDVQAAGACPQSQPYLMTIGGDVGGPYPNPAIGQSILKGIAYQLGYNVVQSAVRKVCGQSPVSRSMKSVRNGAIVGATSGAYTGFVSGEIFGGEVSLGTTGLGGAVIGGFIGGGAGATKGLFKGVALAEICEAVGAYN